MEAVLFIDSGYMNQHRLHSYVSVSCHCDYFITAKNANCYIELILLSYFFLTL